MTLQKQSYYHKIASSDPIDDGLIYHNLQLTYRDGNNDETGDSTNHQKDG